MIKPREVPGQFRKTKFCRFFESGSCRYETGCTFAHTLQELEDLPDLKKTSICKSWQSGCCKLSADECTYAHGKEDLRRAPFSGKKSRNGKKAAASYKETQDGSDDNSTSCGDSQGYEIPFVHMDSRGSVASTTSSQPFSAQDDTNWPLPWDPLGSSSAAERDFGCLELSLNWGQTVLKEQGRRGKKSKKYRQEAVENDMHFVQSCPLPVLLDVLSQQQQYYDGNNSPVLTPTMSPYADSVILTPVIGYADTTWGIEEMLKNAMPEHYED